MITEMFQKDAKSPIVEKHVKTAKQCLLDYLLSNQRSLVQKNNTKMIITRADSTTKEGMTMTEDEDLDPEADPGL